MARPKELDLADWNDLVGAFHNESDRGAAILAGSFTEHALGLYLRFRMRDQKIADELFAPMGPLSSFSQRIAIAYAFGFMSELHYKDFELIRRMKLLRASPSGPTFDARSEELGGAPVYYEDANELGSMSRARVAYLLACGWTSGSLLDEMEGGTTK
jgi:hypothetical protein